MTPANFLKQIPKAELHLHIEGTLTPAFMLKLAKKNCLSLPFSTIEEATKSYDFQNLQSFLDIYYQAVAVLITEQDFYDLTINYLESAYHDGTRHVEIFFDPQSHLQRGIPFSTFLNGIYKALEVGQKKFGISFYLIMCFLRHLSEADAYHVLNLSLPFKDKIIGVGLDSSELGHPPSKFQGVFTKAREAGYFTVAHAGEEGPSEYVWEALNLLKVKRIDHGVACTQDPNLVQYLATHQIPLTVCPLSNVKLAVFKEMEEHNLKYLFDHNVCVTINSDDPAFFGGSLLENYLQVYERLNFTLVDMLQLAKNSFAGSFLPLEKKEFFFQQIDLLKTNLSK